MTDQIEQIGVMLETHQKVCPCYANFSRSMFLIFTYYCDAIYLLHIFSCCK